MPFASISLSGRNGRSQSTVTFRPGIECLEDRSVPATLVSQALISPTQTEVADAPVIILGASDDGNYLLLQSEATNLVSKQITPPGETNLFWYDQTNNVFELVSIFDASNSTRFNGFAKSLGVEPSSPGGKLNAVISQDGQSVAFISSAPASDFNSTVSTANDPGGADVFVWSFPTKGKATLVSKTTTGFAMGAGQVSNPTISPNGTLVTFVSTANAQNVMGDKQVRIQNTAFFDDWFIDDDVSPDLFRVTVGASAIPVSFDESVIGVDTINKITLDRFQFIMHGDVEVDPLNRYVTAGAAGLVAIRTNQGPFAGRDVWSYTFDSSQPISFNFDPVTAVPRVFAPGTKIGPAAAGVGTFDNVIRSAGSGEDYFTYKVLNTGGELITGYVNLNGGAASPNAGFDLYRIVTTTSATPELLSAEAGSSVRGANDVLDLDPRAYNVTPNGTKLVFTSAATNLVTNVTDENGTFDIFQRDNTTRANRAISLISGTTITGNGPSVHPVQTPDALVVAFESTATNLTNTIDNNNQTDVFVFDKIRGDLLAVSSTTGGVATGDDISFGPVIARASQVDTDFYRNFRVYFSSEAHDLDPGIQLDPTDRNAQLYVQDFPIFVSQIPRTFAYSGGTGGFVATAFLDANGQVVTTAKYQPVRGWTGDLRVASGDLNGDGVLDVVVGVGPGGGPRVVMIDGFNGRILNDFFAFEPSFTGGVYVAAADMDGDGKDEVIVGAGEGGGPRFQVYDNTGTFLLVDRFAYEADSRTGVRVAAGDFNGDGQIDIVVGAGIGGGPRIRVFDGQFLPTLVTLADFFAFERTLRGGAYISSDDFDGDGFADLAVGGGPEGGPRVRVFNAVNIGGFADPQAPEVFLDFFAFDQNSRDGARPILRDIDGDKTADLLVGTGGGFPRIRTFIGGNSGGTTTPTQAFDFVPFDSLIGQNGAWVG